MNTSHRQAPTKPGVKRDDPDVPSSDEQALAACRDAALRFLSYRPRSVAEVRRRLTRQGHAADVIEATVQWLAGYQFVDDRAFAEFWAESRAQFRPSGQRLLRVELAQRGVPADLAREVVASVDEEEGAYRAAVKRAAKLARDDEDAFRRKLGAFLERRGFDYDVIARTVERIWREPPVS